MARFEYENYLDLAEDELKAAKLVLAVAATPLIFFLSTLGYLGSLNDITKAVATVSLVAFMLSLTLWGLSTVMCQLCIVSVRYERAQGIEDDALREHAEKMWTAQNKVTSKWFPIAAGGLLVGFVAMCAFVFLVIWCR